MRALQAPNQAQQLGSPDVTRSRMAPAGPSSLTSSHAPAQWTIESPVADAPSPEAPPGKNSGANMAAVNRFAHDFSRIPVHGEPPSGVQPSRSASSPAVHRTWDPVRALSEHYTEGEHAKAVGAIHEAKGDGVPLSSSLRATMRAHLGDDFGDVRIHTDGFAERAAGAIGANAFTVQRDIFFGRGMFAPERPGGLFRLAHELAHTLQQRGSASPGAAASETLEEEAERAVLLGPRRRAPLTAVGPVILREPTYPRRSTGDRMIREVERVLTMVRDTSSTDELTQKWSNVDSNFSGPVSAGSIARRIWTHLFLRHFVEPESQPGVESAHPRYVYSRTYGWIDMQHFFGFIDFAEQQFNRTGSRQQALDAATAQGLQVETDQQRVRDYVVFGSAPSYGPERLMQVRPPITPAFQAPRAAAGALATSVATLVGRMGLLRGTQREVFSQLDAQQRQKFYTDSAKSAFTYEDFQSNQLGTRFFLRHGAEINAQPVAAREVMFRTRLASFFADINVVNDQTALDERARRDGLPGQERFLAPKTTEAAVRERHPELFTLPP